MDPIFRGKLYRSYLFQKQPPPDRHTTSNRRQFHVDITSIRWRPNFYEFPRHFHVLLIWKKVRGNNVEIIKIWSSTYWSNIHVDGPKFHVVSTYCFRRNFDGRKIGVVSTYFFRCNFAGRNIHVVSTYFFRCNFDGRKNHVVFTYFFWCNFSGRKIHFGFHLLFSM